MRDLYPAWITDELKPGEDTVDFYGTKEVAVMFRVAQSTVQQWIRAKKLRVVNTPGRAARIPHTEIRRAKRESVDVPDPA